MKAGRTITTHTRGALAWLVVAIVLFFCSGCGNDDSPEPKPTTASKRAVQVEELGKGDQAASLNLDVDGPVQVNNRRITLPPGTGTGKHCHYGDLIAAVAKGTLTHYAPIYPSGVHKYKAGESIHEGSGYIHEGKNEGDQDVVLMVTYVTPEGKPLAETDLDHCDSD